MNVPYRLHFEPNAKDAVLIAPGSSGGMNQSLVKAVFERAATYRQTAFVFDYPFFERGDTGPSSGLVEEVTTMADATSMLHELGLRRLHIIGKSLGAIVASNLLKHSNQVLNLPADEEPEGDWSSFAGGSTRLTILGCALGELTIDDLSGTEVDIVQGEADRFGSDRVVQEAVAAAGRSDIRVVGIPNANHSFRDKDSYSTCYEQAAVHAIRWDAGQ